MPCFNFDVLVYQEDGYWVAHVVDLDLVTSARDLDEVKHDAVKVCAAQVEYALRKDLLDTLFRPSNPEICRRMGRAYATGGLIVEATHEVIDQRVVNLQFLKAA